MDDFTTDKNAITTSGGDEHNKFNAQLQQFVIGPFADRLHSILTELFQQLNFDDQLIKDIKEIKRSKRQSKRQHSLSAHKNTPTKGANDITRSPNATKKKRNCNLQSVVTQTDYIIPVNNNDMQESSNSDCQNEIYRPSYGT